MWIIVLSIIAAVVLTLIATKLWGNGSPDETSEDSESLPDADCCGAHEVCDKETLLSSSDEIVYYQDEELDAYTNRLPDSYNNDEIEAFREVLYTMNDGEVAGWLRSLQLRNIQPPIAIRDEALMIVADIRDIIRKSRV
ncbi:hypothetical protein [Alkalitalea saponilacus]|uniref:Phospholipase n=1 Tax=Alkalitalea saponilacus TaxID=889453 RepID=A0A1T5HST6_9BACT|nr:hypothetical protein [Alkalitalea saponilacus]ASB49273.1 hypothetical protein CDL62_09030 [Alkalitalea saponilacus]SKC23758.1 hypothetical protein SAMN03080601_03043 [Alkalitalea saponilacus]